MAKRVLYSTETGFLIQWQDTDHFGYADPIEGTALLEVSEAEWSAREQWKSVKDGSLSVEGPVYPEPPPPPVPQSVTRFQAEVHMRRISLWAQADALFTAMDDADERKIAWLRAPTFNRESPALVYAAQQLGITDADLDQMFIDASKII